MRVLWLSHFMPYPPNFGAALRSYHLLRAAAKSHALHLVIINNRHTHGSRAEVDSAVAHLRSFCARVEVLDKPADSSRMRWWCTVLGTLVSSRSYEDRWLTSPDTEAALRALPRAGPQAPELLHVDTLGLTQYVRHLPGTPWVLNHHNVESDMMGRRAAREPNPLKKAYFELEARKLARDERSWGPRAAVNLVVSELDAERLAARAPDAPTAVVSNGVDIEYFRPAEPIEGGGRGLVFAGRLSAYTNREAVLFFLRDVWPMLRARDATRTWTVVGSGPPAELRRHRDQGVVATGFVPDVRTFLDRAAIYVCPIFDGGGTRLKILDALAMAKPLVATKFSVQGLDLEEGRHYLRAETPGEFVEAIERLESDSGLRRKLAREGRRRVQERYSWAVIGERLLEAYLAASQA